MRASRRSAWWKAGAGASLLCSVAVPAAARLETLRFVDTNPEPSPVVGFRLYVGPDPDHATAIEIGMPPGGAGGIRSFPLLVEGDATVHLALTAYDAEGRESGPSNRIVRAPRGPAFDHDGDGASDLLRIDRGSGRIEILPDGGAGASRTLPLTAPPRA